MFVAENVYMCIDSTQHDAAEQADLVVTLLAHVQVVLASNLSQNTGYLDRMYMVPQSLQANAWTVHCHTH
jgi:hypothetical protein